MNLENKLLEFETNIKTLAIKPIKKRYMMLGAAMLLSNELREEKLVKENRGVIFDKAKNKFRASIRINGRQIYLGIFDTFKEAQTARQKMEATL